MGVYIKNMEMPINEPLLVKINPDGSVSTTARNDYQKYEAIPVPEPHGRLIDADALADVFRSFIAMYDSCPFSQLSLPDKARRDELQSALAEVINAPTIIPAEGGADTDFWGEEYAEAKGLAEEGE